MKRLVIDARVSGESTGRYIDKLIEYLYELKPDIEVIILTKAHRLQFFKQLTPGFQVMEAPHKEFTFAEQFDFKKQLDDLGADLVHFGMVQQPIRYRGRVISTIHDLTTARFTNPDKNPVVFKLKQQVYKYVIRQAARKSVAVITPSNYVKQDLMNFSGIAGDKIMVTYEAADKIIEVAEPVPALKNRQFVMYIGRPTPHKNLERLIEAFVSLRDDHPDLMIVLAGKKDANYQRIEQNVRQKGFKNIYFTDFVDDGQLRWLYEHCAAYVFPSLSEGFGLPGLEAMVHGAPVVSSNATCLPEIYGDGAHYFDPLDTLAMAAAIHEVLMNPGLREDLIKKGREQAAKYSWQRMAEQTLNVYEQSLKIH